MAALFVSHLAAMEQLAATHPPPFVAVLGSRGLQVMLTRPAPDRSETDESAPPTE
jgi:hypothetical protein